MISISDNTATDHLIRYLGRERIESILTIMGMNNPSKNIPFLTTAKLFSLEGILLSEKKAEYLKSNPIEKKKLLYHPASGLSGTVENHTA